MGNTAAVGNTATIAVGAVPHNKIDTSSNDNLSHSEASTLSKGVKVACIFNGRQLGGEIINTDRGSCKVSLVDGNVCSYYNGHHIVSILGEDEFEMMKKFQEQVNKLTSAASRGISAEVSAIIGSDSTIIDAQDKDGQTALMHASIHGHTHIMKTLLLAGADIDARDDHGLTVLHKARDGGDLNALRLLITEGADKDAVDPDGHTVLLKACKLGKVDQVQLLLSVGADPEVTDHEGNTCLLVTKKADVLDTLLRHGANVNAQDKDGCTVLMKAIANGEHDFIDSILKAKSLLINKKDHCGEIEMLPKPRVLESPHPYSAGMNEHVPVEIPGAYSYQISFDENTSLYTDPKTPRNTWASVRFYKDQTYTTVWGEALYTGGYDDVSGDGSKNFPGVNGKSELLITEPRFVFHFYTHDEMPVSWGYKMTVTPLYCSDENTKGWTALMWAAYTGRTSIVEKILQKDGVLKEVQGWDGRTALSWAIDAGHQDAAIVLMRGNCRLDIPDKEGVRPIEKAVRKGFDLFISETLRNFDPFVGNTSVFKEGAAFTWIHILSSTESHVEEIGYVLDKYGDRIRALTEVEDEGGRKAIGLARSAYEKVIMERLYFYKRYELKEGPAEHRSGTCIVHLAKDHHNKGKQVALKFISDRGLFDREVLGRNKTGFEGKYVIAVLEFYDGDKLMDFREESTRKSLYPYCVVMPAAERNLFSIISHEHIAGRAWSRIEMITRELISSLQHMHQLGYIHGDLNPLNIMRSDGAMILVDLDASEPIGDGNHPYAGTKVASAFVPPEMLEVIGEDTDDPEIILKTGSNLEMMEKWGVTFEPIRVHPSLDMWAAGVTLYQLFSGETLFSSNDEGNIDQSQLRILYDWSDEFKEGKISKIKNSSAKNLIGRLLSKDPSKRPDASRVLAHPFLSGQKAARLIGEKANFDYFISYRVASDFYHSEVLYNLLNDGHAKVFWDKVSIEPGVPWEESFCDGLINSRVFIPIISCEGMFNKLRDFQNFEKLENQSKCDNVLLEYRLALELKSMGLIEAIYPVIVGDWELLNPVTETTENEQVPFENRVYKHFGIRTSNINPSVVVDSIEKKVREHLNRQGLGNPLIERQPVKDIVDHIMAHQGGHLEGPGLQTFHNVKDTLKDILSKLKAHDQEEIKNLSLREEVQHLRAKVLALSFNLKHMAVKNSKSRSSDLLIKRVMSKDLSLVPELSELKSKIDTLEVKNKALENELLLLRQSSLNQPGAKGINSKDPVTSTTGSSASITASANPGKSEGSNAGTNDAGRGSSGGVHGVMIAKDLQISKLQSDLKSCYDGFIEIRNLLQFQIGQLSRSSSPALVSDGKIRDEISGESIKREPSPPTGAKPNISSNNQKLLSLASNLSTGEQTSPQNHTIIEMEIRQLIQEIREVIITKARVKSPNPNRIASSRSLRAMKVKDEKTEK